MCLHHTISIGICQYITRKIYIKNRKNFYGGNRMQKMLIIGATSGIGRATAVLFHKLGYKVVGLGRREEMLISLKEELGDRFTYAVYDMASDDAVSHLQDILAREGRVDIVFLCAGVGYRNREYDINKEEETIAVNVVGFSRAAHTVMEHFFSQGGGHLICASSIAGVRGVGTAAYGASKAYISNYADSLRIIAEDHGCPITITDYQPGFVDTAMGQASSFWRISAEEAAEYVHRAVLTKCEHIYVSSRWRLIAYLMRILPHRILRNIICKQKD